MNYNIIQSDSTGNATIIEKLVLIDCGCSYKKLKSFIKDVKIVLLSHVHSDHFNKTTIKLIAENRPNMRFGCGKWLVQPLLECGVNPKKIDVYEMGKIYDYKRFKLIANILYHNVKNCAYSLDFNGQKALYATDTNEISHISAKNYDLYLVECNHDVEHTQMIINEKEELGEFSYEKQALENHLSADKYSEFILDNASEKSICIPMHMNKKYKEFIQKGE